MIQFKVNGDKTLNDAAVKLFIMDNLVSENYEKSAVDDIIKKCGKFVHSSIASQNENCDRMQYQHFKCIKDLLFWACPEDLQVQYDICDLERNDIRKYYKL